MLTANITSMTHQSAGTVRKAAEAIGVEPEDFTSFFQDISASFWKNFNPKVEILCGFQWDQIQSAFREARRRRRTIIQPGLSHSDKWMPWDIAEGYLHWFVSKEKSLGNA